MDAYEHQLTKYISISKWARTLISSTWQQRAEALAKIGVI